MGGVLCHEEAVLEGFDDAQVTVNGHAQQREDQVCAQKYTCETIDLYRIEQNSFRNFDLRLLFFNLVPRVLSPLALLLWTYCLTGQSNHKSIN